MKTFYLTAYNNNIWVDTENETTGVIERENTYYIDALYVIEEPMHVVYQNGDTREELDVKKGDILLKWSNKNIKNHITIVKSKGALENYKSIHEEEQRAKEEWAKKCECDNCEVGCVAC